MSLKWRKDGTAKCGNFEYGPNMVDEWHIWLRTKYGRIRITNRHTSKGKFEPWLKNQAEKILKYLEGK